MAVYKKDQGIVARRTAFWLVLLLALWGCYRLYIFLQSNFSGLKGQSIGQMPLLEVDMNWAFGIAMAVLVGAGWGIWKIFNRQKPADLLIDTESELKKVTWPSFQDAVNSSVIVIVTVIIFAAFLSVADMIYEVFFDALFLS